MVKERRRVSLFGATGSIGLNAVDLLKRHKSRFEVDTVAANRKAVELAEIARQLGAKHAVLADESAHDELCDALHGSGITSAAGESALLEAAARDVDVVIMAITGAAGLRATFAAAETGATLALANKESVVCAGDILISKIEAAGGKLLPVDSEHNAIFQLIDGRGRFGLSRVTLTASGGPFLNWPAEKIAAARPRDALAHPVWRMGNKISVDCASLMNKGLELIEAQHFFSLQPQQLGILIHPQSVMHAMIAFNDGAVLAHMATPDMRVAISSCLAWPERLESGAKSLDLAQMQSLTFKKADEAKFPCLRLAREAMDCGGLAPCVLNAANEIAVGGFLKSEIGFMAIPAIIEATLNRLAAGSLSRKAASLNEVLAADREARTIAANFMPHYGVTSDRTAAVG